MAISSRPQVLGLLPAIVDDVGGDFFLDVGHCNDAMLAALSDSERDVLRALQVRSGHWSEINQILALRYTLLVLWCINLGEI